MQRPSSKLVPLVATQTKSCSGSHKEPSWTRQRIAMGDKLQQQDFCACPCVYVDYGDVNYTSFFLTSGLGCLRRCCKSLFLQTKHNAKENKISFISKIGLIQQITFLSILGVSSHLTYIATLTIWSLAPSFTAWIIMQRCHSGNLWLLTICFSGYCAYIPWTKVVQYYIHI